jgi:hypothetical protein
MHHHSSSSTSSPGPKFIRRMDLTPLIRLQIGLTALLAQQQKQWGAISRLAREYLLSRTFVYLLALQVEQVGSAFFGRSTAEVPLSMKAVRLPYAYLLSLRLEGRCSLNAISAIMARFDLAWSSVGKLSETLNALGGALDNTISVPDGTIRLVVFASDEIFAGTQPILVTVDPQSSAILRIELVVRRRWEEWAQHWHCLSTNGCQAIYLVCDGGQALAKAQKVALSDVWLQPDTYHALAHRLGAWKSRLETRAYGAISTEYKRFKSLDSARSEAVITARIDGYVTARRQADAAIARYDDFVYLYDCLMEQLAIFDATGRLRDRSEAEAQMRAALDLLDTLGVKALNKAVAKTRRTLPELLQYFEVAKTVVPALIRELPIAPATFRLVCQAYHWHTSGVTTKATDARHACTARERARLERAATDSWYTRDIQEHIYAQLDRIVQSSSMVECINSILRPYLDGTRNQVTQELLNLIMFYHNHRRYRAGKRSEKTPMELFTGQPQPEDWLDLLCDEVERKQPDFFAASR